MPFAEVANMIDYHLLPLHRTLLQAYITVVITSVLYFDMHFEFIRNAMSSCCNITISGLAT